MSRRDTEILLDGAPVGGGVHAGLAELLVAASAPARPVELAGEEAALAAFRRAYAAGPAAGRSRRRVAVAALSVVAALVGGTAYAAGTSRLPDPVQQRLHEALSGIGVPPASSDASPSASPGGSPGTSSDPADLTLLCRAWQSTRATPGAPELRPDDQRSLAAAAGGPGRIADYCATLTATPSAPGATTPGSHGNTDPGGPPATRPGTPPAPTPGNGNGNGNGNGHGTTGPPADPGNGNGNGHATGT